MFKKQTLLFLSIYSFFILTQLNGQNMPPCPNVLVINENPIPSSNYSSAHAIWSAGKVDSMSNIVMKANDFVALDYGFEVKEQATFLASLDGCISDCEEQLPICEGEPCPPIPYELDSLNRKYEPNSVLVSLPQELQVNQDYALLIQLYLDTMSQTPTGMSQLKRCMCEENIFIYESNIDINEESTIGQATAGYRPRGEGVTYSLNYYLEPDFADKDDDTPTTMFNPNSFGESVSQTQHNIIAFLDSGVDPALMPPQVIRQNPPDPCFIDDMYGWNFVDDNNNILDDRGHGTTAILSYLNALNQIGVPLSSQVILPVKVLDGCGRGTIYSVVCGLYYARRKGAKIINNSWGMYFNDVQLQNAMIDINNSAIAVSCSAGNSAKDLDNEEHFPSGYAQDYTKIRRDYTSVDTSGLAFVFEVGGLCRGMSNSMPAPIVPLWPESNHRDFMFVEAAIRVEDLLNIIPNIPEPIMCGISGTSYAAPRLTAGLIHFCQNSPAGTAITQAAVFSNSQQINPSNDHYSYILDKL